MSTDDGMDIVLEQSRVEWLILADEAEVVNGKLYMMGGGWDRLTAQSLPWRQHMAIAVAIRVPWMDTNRQTSVEIDLQDGAGTSLAKVDGQFVVGRPAQSVPGQPFAPRSPSRWTRSSRSSGPMSSSAVCTMRKLPSRSAW